MERTYVRRRRTVAAILLTSILLVGSPVARAVGGPDEALPTPTHVVAAGDTLWSIAGRHAPGEDPRAVVHAIEELNDLGDGPLLPGHTLTLPPVG